MRLLESLEGGGEHTLASHGGLEDKAKPANHGKAAVLELGRSVLLAAAEVEGVPAEVAGVGGASRGLLASRCVHVEEGVAANSAKELRGGSELNEEDDTHDLRQAERGGRGERLEGRLGRAEELRVGGRARQAVALLHEEAEGGEHAHAAVLDLSGTQPVQIPEVGQAKRVEANVAEHGAVELRRALLEGHRGGHLHLLGDLLDHLLGGLATGRDLGAAGHGLGAREEEGCSEESAEHD
mmetsp:Transcript_2444/g.6956  ORF Transcript_2444/g.6956 Transcript_2444/m.6956 type:complete len:239 (-) Transcript_2444:36-752(-)